MNRRRQVRRRWYIRLLKAAGIVAALVVLGFLLLQLLLATPWMRGKVATKLSNRIGGLEVTIGGLGWTPWSGATLRGLRVEQPEPLRKLDSKPLLEVDEIHAWPDYEAAMRGEWTTREVTVLSPKIHLTAEMLAGLAASAMPEAQPPVVVDQLVFQTEDVLSYDPLPPIPGLEFTPVSADDPEEVEPMMDSIPADIHLDISTLPVNPANVTEAPVEPEPELPQEETGEPSPAGSDEVESVAPEENAPTAEASLGRSIHMRIRDGSFELVWIGRSLRLAAMEGLHFDLPMFGDEERTTNSVGLLEVFGQAIEENLEIELISQGRNLTFLLPDEEEGGRLSGKIDFGLMGGLPFRANLTLHPIPFGPVEMARLAVAKAGEASASVQGGGWLLVPGSLNGVAQVKADQVSGEISGVGLSFDSAAGELRLSGGLLQSPDFRLIGDEASLLGNGWATSRDGAAVVRVVVPYALVGGLNQGLNELLPEAVFAFKPLEPDNRWYSDVSLWRGERGWIVEFGGGGSEVPIENIIADD